MFGNVWYFVIILELVRIIRIESLTRLNLSITYRQTGRSGQNLTVKCKISSNQFNQTSEDEDGGPIKSFKGGLQRTSEEGGRTQSY